MEQKDVERIDRSFEKLLAEASHGIGKIYSQIGELLKDVPVEGIAGATAKNEAELVNNFILDFVASVKRTAMEEMVMSGCKEYLTEGAWSSVLRTAGMPQIKFCKVQPEQGQEAFDPHRDSKILKKQKEEYENMKTGSEAAMAAGAAAMAAGLFIPALGKTVSFVACTAGGIGIVAGGIGLAYSRKKLRGFEHSEQPADAEPSLNAEDWIRTITEGQRELNLGIISKWLKKVKAALLTECDKWLTA